MTPRELEAYRLAQLRARGPQHPPASRVTLPSSLSNPFATRGVYAPPDPPPQQAQRPASSQGVIDVEVIDKDRESVSRNLALNAGIETPIYQTIKRWCAIDVYVNVPQAAMTDGDILSVYVYAIAQGVRTLVGSGRYRHFAGGAIIEPNIRQWVCAIRAGADKYEVTYAVSRVGDGITTPTPPVLFSIIGTDRTVRAPSWVGVIPVGPVGSSLCGIYSAGNNPAVNPTELIILNDGNTVLNAPPSVLGPGIQLVAWGAITTTAARYVQIYDNVTAPGLGGPNMLEALPVAGSGFYRELDQIQSQRYTIGIVMVGSSTPASHTAVATGQIVMEMWIR